MTTSALTVALLALIATTHSIAAAPPGTHTGGLWKAAVPLAPMPSEFDGFDPLGIVAGARIKADCSLNWIDPDEGKRYCFSSGTSLEVFLDRPRANILRARRVWEQLTLKKIGDARDSSPIRPTAPPTSGLRRK